MRYKLGRFLQLIGLLILPVGIAGNLARPDMVNVGQSLLIASVGMVLFYLGWSIQGKSAP